jgi:hypothetical protein
MTQPTARTSDSSSSSEGVTCGSFRLCVRALQKLQSESMPKCNKFSPQYTILVVITPISSPQAPPSSVAPSPPPHSPLQSHRLQLAGEAFAAPSCLTPQSQASKSFLLSLLKHAPSYIAHESQAQHSCNVCVAGLHRQDAHRRRSCNQGERARQTRGIRISFTRRQAAIVAFDGSPLASRHTRARARAFLSSLRLTPPPLSQPKLLCCEG